MISTYINNTMSSQSLERFQQKHNDTNRGMLGERFRQFLYSTNVEDYLPFPYFAVTKNDIIESFDMNKIIPFDQTEKTYQPDKEQLSEELEKILDDIDSGKTEMITYENADEFLKQMHKELEDKKEE